MKTAYPSAAHQRHGLSQRHTYGCTHRGLGLFSSVDIQLLRTKAKGQKYQTHWRVLIAPRADYKFNEGWGAWLLCIGQ
ncbi:hypothetical protein K443DRAFT_679686 [Laccaria amethystina LaAM-08-1]|uniref:Uncharacterized protein n=1 Tax=Laccaria amethystina LaAM-08-1 TaxID=1095629 RepID=A0A0C9WPB3_9AGAR|nr:hypothetical protein K443DRAFT_679686 [Laccaria amethystina LaAM-08-1]